MIINPTEKFEIIRIAFGSNRGILNDKYMLDTLKMDNVQKVEIMVNTFQIQSEKKAKAIKLEEAEEFEDFAEAQNEIYQREGRNVEFLITNAGEKQHFEYELVYYLPDREDGKYEFL